MSLDVYLTLPGAGPTTGTAPQIYIRDHGQTMAISREEWDRRFPGQEPVMVATDTDREEARVYEANITHNLRLMAVAAGLYHVLWRPEESGYTAANQLIEPLRQGLAVLKAEPERFKAFEAPNGWGTYDQFVPWVERYLAACERYPTAQVSVWR